MSTRPTRVFLSAAEPSGDLHAADLIRALRQLDPTVQTEGLGGEKMAAAGCRLRADVLKHAVMFHKIVSELGTFLPVFAETDKHFAENPPDVLVIIDSPGLNFPLARRAKSRGIPVLYYIPPQLWAWGRRRIRKLRNRVSRVACIFPFEEEMYRAAGVPVRFVGHPLLDAIARETARPPAADAFGPGSPKIGILPGSRAQEIASLLPPMLQTAAAIRAKHPQAELSLGPAHAKLRPAIDAAVAASGLPVRTARTYDIMRTADLTLIASGTAALECALLGSPMIILYHVNPLFALVGRLLIRCAYIGLPNIVAGRRIVPEFAPVLPPTATIIAEALDILEKPQRQAEIRAELAALRTRLGEPGAALRAAAEALELAAESRRRHRDGARRGSSGIIW
jgi:lipid-A-disaccharide synthase